MFWQKWVPHEDAIGVSGMAVRNEADSSRTDSKSKPSSSRAQHKPQTPFNRWIGAFMTRYKRSVVRSKLSYKLKTANDELTPFGFIAKTLRSLVQTVKGKSTRKTYVHMQFVRH
ncbi:unnamed protein product [Anisakis simplex]|uniref:Transposase n=1 Tax=Anisakis simplex TaxID=6269 RepID=A0A0M3J9N1_ANISI|nr:unnamed protein product [Anisakis simplex]